MPNVVFRPRVSERVPSQTWFAELATAPGPQVIGQTGDNSYAALFGREWLLEWSVEDDHLRLYQESLTHPGEWERVTSPLPPIFDAALPVTARRVSFCFDQSARIILAYEDQGVVKVTRWDVGSSVYVQNVTFSGVDPCVVMDASWRYLVPDSDVLLFHLSPDRERVLCRVQRDVYGTEYELWDYGAPVILDRVVALPYRYQVLVAGALGAPLPDALVSAQYPLALTTGAHLGPAYLEGDYRQVAQAYAPQLGAELIPEFVAGALTLPTTTYSPLVAAELTPDFISGALKNVVTQYPPAPGVDLTPSYVDGALDEIGVPYAPSRSVALTPEFVGGTYEPV